MSPPRSSSPAHETGSSEHGLSARTSPLALLGNLRRRPLQAAIVAGSVLLALTGIAVGAWFVVGLKQVEKSLPAVETALEMWDQGETEEALELAKKLLASDKLEFEERGGPLFILGMAAAHEAEIAQNEEQQPGLYAVAGGYLSEARDHGFPEGREASGLYHLAQCEFLAGHFKASLPILLEARRVDPKHRTELTGWAVKACLQDETPRLAEALKYNQQYLAAPKLPDADRQTALLERAQIQFLLGEFDACGKTLDEISTDKGIAAGVGVVRARLLIQRADQAQVAAPEPTEPAQTEPAGAPDSKGLYEEAAKLLRPIQSRVGSADQAVRDAQLLLGHCLLKLGDQAGAEKQFSRARRLNLGKVQGIAASLEEADLLRQSGRLDSALSRYKQLIEDLGPPEQYRNLWLTLDQLRGRLESAVDGLRNSRKFDAASELVDAIAPLLAQVRLVELKAELQHDWGQSLAKEAEKAPLAETAKLQAASRAKFRDAGVSFGQLAEMRKADRKYPDDVWRSAQSFAAGQDYRSALRKIKQYLSDETRKRRSEALVSLGQCYLALNKLDQAAPPLLECVENFRKHPDSYRARLVASQVYLEKNQLEEAKDLLIDNLENESLAPSSLEWRDSLFALGKLLYREANDLETLSRKQGVDSPYPDVVKVGLKDLERSFNAYQDAIDRLSEAVQRYPDAPQAIESRYLIAESHRQAAKWPRKLRGTVAIESSRAALLRQTQQELTAAVKEYEPLLAILNERQEKGELSPLEMVTMRNCYFARADALFDLGRFEDAIAAYSSATNRYHDRPEALEAFVQIASCYRRLNRPAEARGTLEQAKVVLRRIPADATFTQTTRYDRGEWTQLLNWLSSL